MIRRRWLFGVTVFLFLMASGIGHALTKTESFFKGNMINFIVTTSPGGGFDLYARMIAPALEKYTGSSVVIKNIPGGGSIVGTNALFNAKPNGLNIGILNGTGMVLGQLMEQKGARYDMKRFTIIGRISADEEFVYIGSKSPFKTLDALLNSKDKETKWVSNGKTDSVYYRVVLVCELLRLHRAKTMTGYPGSTEANLAILRGDADGTAGTYSSRQSLVDAGEFIPVLILAKKRSNAFPKVPSIYEVPGLSASDRSLIDFLIGLDQLGRLIAAPPSLEQGKTNYLRAVLRKVCEDPGVVARAKKEKRDIDYAPHEDIAQMIKDVLNAPPDTRKRIDEALKRYD
jgi:tripartite-type tricarboxylate transporter receptor subunit TctC